jgi:hypothetical protein
MESLFLCIHAEFVHHNNVPLPEVIHDLLLLIESLPQFSKMQIHKFSIVLAKQRWICTRHFSKELSSPIHKNDLFDSRTSKVFWPKDKSLVIFMNLCFLLLKEKLQWEKIL